MTQLTSLATVRTVRALRTRVAAWRHEGLSVGFAPTMGALHEGHLSLVRLARSRSGRVIASLFVNPAQFAPGEDFEAYPRDEAKDAALLANAGCDLLFAPSVEEMYPAGFSTRVAAGDVAAGLESAARPHFFDGVATVVSKLLNQARPDVAVFGEKDYQQLLVIRRLAADLDLGVEILAAPTVREPDGLAMSSRNAYLAPPERAIAAHLSRVLRMGADALERGSTPRIEEARARDELQAAGFDAIDYVAVRDAMTLKEPPDAPLEQPCRILAAVKVGKTRLIDNFHVGPARG